MSTSIPNRTEPSGSPALATLRPTLLEIGNSSEFIAELRAGSACRHHCSSEQPPHLARVRCHGRTPAQLTDNLSRRALKNAGYRTGAMGLRHG